jgi:hypothetical protein
MPTRIFTVKIPNRSFNVKVPARNCAVSVSSRKLTVSPPNRNIFGDATANRVVYGGYYSNILWLTWGDTTVYPFDPTNLQTFGDYP